MNSYLTPLPWRRVWVTGAGRGIGAALASLLCHQGVTVYASARDSAGLEQLRDSHLEAAGEILPVSLDIRDSDAVRAQIERWCAQQIMPELSVLNAGTHDPFPAQEFTSERCRQLLDINLQGTINCLDSVLYRYLEAGYGQIAVMASVAGYRGLPTAAAYGASKAALINLTEALRLDLRGSGVKIQLINPGFVRTPLTDKNTFAMPALMEPEDAAGRILSGLLSDRFEIVFPRRFVYVLKLLRVLPYRWYFPLVAKMTGADKGKEHDGDN